MLLERVLPSFTCCPRVFSPVVGADWPIPVLPCLSADAPPAPGRPQGAIDSELHHAASHGAPAASVGRAHACCACPEEASHDIAALLLLRPCVPSPQERDKLAAPSHAVSARAVSAHALRPQGQVN